MPKVKKSILKFKAIKYSYIDDEDGAAKLTFRVDMKNKLPAFAIPVKKMLEITIEILPS